MTFAWALFNAEENSYISTAKQLPTSRLPEVDFELRSITLGPAATSFSVAPTSARCYVESFGRSSSFISQGRSKKQIRLLDQDSNRRANAGIVLTREALNSSVNPDSSSKDVCMKGGANSSDNNAALLVYRPPSPVSRKRKISDVESTVERKNGRNDCSTI